MSEENKELSPDELMAQQYANEESQSDELADQESGDETSESADELMAQQMASQTYESAQDQLEDFSDHEITQNSKVNMLLDIPLEVTVEIGSTEMPIEDVLKLNPNSVIELDRYVNEPVDLKVNGRIIAKGELYTVKNNFGIKITHIITPEDRLKILDI